MAHDPRLIKPATRPGKQFMFLTVGAALEKLPPYQRVLDIACGRMALVPTFAGKDYIGVDGDESNLRFGRAKYPGTAAICGLIEELPPKLVGDLVLCLQCIGYNQYFKDENTITCVNKLVEATRVGGTLILNLGTRVRGHFGSAEAVISDRFESVDVVRFGRFQTRLPTQVCVPLGYMMFYLPFLAKSSRNPERLYICRGRR